MLVFIELIIFDLKVLINFLLHNLFRKQIGIIFFKNLSI